MRSFAVFRFFTLFLLLSFISACTTSSDVVRRTAEPEKVVEGGSVEADVLKAKPDQDNIVEVQEEFRNVADGAEELDLFKRAQEAQKSGEARLAEKLYGDYVRVAPEGQYVDRVSLRLAKIAMERHDYRFAKEHFRRVVELSPPSRFRARAQFGEARAELAMGQTEAALRALASINFKEVRRAEQGEVFAFWSKAAAQDGRWLESTLAAIKARNLLRAASDQQEQAAFVREQIERRLVEAELKLILREYPRSFPANEAQLRLATLYLARGDKPGATQLLTQILSTAPAGSAVWERAQSLQSRSHRLEEVANYRVGVLLPLSGRRGGFSREIIDGLKLALKGTKIEVVLADAGPNKVTLQAAFERLVFEDRVMAVVGPLSGSNAELVAQWAVEYGVPNISLSSKPEIPEKGQFVFRTALTPAKQVQALVRYSREKLEASNFAVLFPQDKFGEVYAKEYVNAVRMLGGRLSAAESYSPKQTDFKVPIANMIGMSYPQFREEELQEKIEARKLELAEERGEERELTSREIREIELDPIIDFDVMFIPDTYRALGQIIPALLYADVKQPVLLGPATWRNPNLLRRAGQYLDGALFVDVWSNERQSSVTRDFIEEFKISVGKAPRALGAIGYDVGLALKKAYERSKMPPSNREELRSRLEYLGEIPGAVGLHIWDAQRDTLAEIQLFRTQNRRFEYLGSIHLD